VNAPKNLSSVYERAINNKDCLLSIFLIEFSSKV